MGWEWQGGGRVLVRLGLVWETLIVSVSFFFIRNQKTPYTSVEGLGKYLPDITPQLCQDFWLGNITTSLPDSSCHTVYSTPESCSPV